MDYQMLLAQPHLSVITRFADGELTRIQDIIEHKVLVDGRGDLEVMFSELLRCARPATPRTLDLIGHSISGKSLLAIGDFVIDMTRPTVSAFFRELAELDVLPRLGVTALRLLGCRTADSGTGRATILALADLLDIEVFGTCKLIYSAHYNAGGFAPERYYALVGSSHLRAEEPDRHDTLTHDPWPQILDIDTLPDTPITDERGPWPHRVASEPQMRELLRHVRRREGAQMPGLLSTPVCEILFPGHAARGFRRAQIVLDGEFARFYPNGDAAPGVVWAVDDPHALVEAASRLPIAPFSRHRATHSERE